MNQVTKENEDKIKEEAKKLIEQTKLMISTLDTNEKTALYQKDLSSPQLDSPKYSLSHRSNVVSLDKHLINTSLIDAKADLKLTVKNLSEKIGELAQRNKVLEKDIREKNNQLAHYTKKINSQNDEVNRLNQIIINERSDNAVIENLKLKRKITALEQTIEENKIIFEQIINEYQEKLAKVTDNHSQSVTQLNQIQENNHKLNEFNEGITNQFNDLHEKISIANIKSEQVEKANNLNERMLEKIQDQMRVLVMMIKELSRIENISYGNNKRIITKLKDITNMNMSHQ